MAKVIVLNFDGPLQSWAGPSPVKTRVDTSREPSVRAVTGLLEASLGVKRDAPKPELLEGVKISILETLKRGKIVQDFQTTSEQANDRVGARPHDTEFYDSLALVYTRGMKSKVNGLALLKPTIIKRTYLGDAQFLVQVKCSTDEDTETLFQHLQNPIFSPYLGRKAFPPPFSFVLGLYDEDEAREKAKEKVDFITKELNSYV